MSNPDSSLNAVQLNEDQINADMQRQAQYEKHRVKLETLRDYIRTNGVGLNDSAAERINSLFDTIKL